MKNYNQSGWMYPGWRVLAGAFACSALAVGFTIYIFGMFIVPITEEFGVSRANANSGMIALQVGMAIVAPIVGRLMDRFSARKIMAVGGVFFGGSLMIASQANSLLFMLGLIVGPLTFGMVACGTLGSSTVVVPWFGKKRGRALGILALSTSAGGIISQPLTAILIENFGWRMALFQIGIITTVGFLLMAVFVILDRPKGGEKGVDEELEGYGSSRKVERTDNVQVEGEKLWTYREIFRNRNFWFLALGIGLLQASDQAMLISQVPYFLDIGYDLSTAAILVSVKTISAIGGKLLVGYLADKVDLRWLFFYVAGSNILLLTVYIMQPSFWFLISAVALLGVAVGGVFPLWTTLMAWLFGARSFGTIMGAMTIITNPFAIVALRYVGEVHDRTGSYVPAFGVFIGMVVLSVILILLLKGDDRHKKAGRENLSKAKSV